MKGSIKMGNNNKYKYDEEFKAKDNDIYYINIRGI